jgi:hypothetical protein
MSNVNSIINWLAWTCQPGVKDASVMAKLTSAAPSHPEAARRPLFLRQWRIYRNLTQEEFGPVPDCPQGFGVIRISDDQVDRLAFKRCCQCR